MRHRISNKPVIFLVFWAALAAAGTANAGLVVEREEPTPQPSFQLVGATEIVQLGEGSPTQATGNGHNVPLPQAMRLLLPQGWSFAPGAGVGVPEVSWSIAPNFIEALRGIANTYSIRFLIDWNHDVLYAERAQPASRAGLGPSRSVNVDWPAADVFVWRLEEGKGLREQLARWSERANYDLFWPDTIPDVPIHAGAEFRGQFLDVMRELAISLDRVDSGLYIDAYPSNAAITISQK